MKIATFIAILDLNLRKTRATGARPALTAAAHMAATLITGATGLITVPSSR